MKSALFVDFDNVYTQLRQVQPAAAERFARQPTEWIRWLIESLEIPEGHNPEARRRLLVRRCYLNPNWYQTYRHAFLRAGFEIVDCPPVTSQGKTSTDIHMVLDIVELLAHETRYDEFIVLSADADFTPVLRKLRRYDRRTSVLAIGFPSAAYQASADLLIDERLFVEQALGLVADPAESVLDAPAPAVAGAAPSTPAAPPPAAPTSPMGVATSPPGASTSPPAAPIDGLAQISQRIEQIVAQSGVPVAAGPLALRLRNEFAQTLDNWNGHGQFKPFFRSLGLLHLVWLNGSGGRIADPARHAMDPLPGAEPDSLGERSTERLPDRLADRHPDRHPDRITDRHTDRITDRITDRQPDCITERNFDSHPEPDPRWTGHDALHAIAREVSNLTGAPLLPPAAVRNILDLLCEDLAAHGYEPTETARRIREQGQARHGLAVSMRDVVFILRGMQLNGHVFGRGQDDARTLAQRLVNQVLFLCEREQMLLDATSVALIRHWIGGDRVE